MEIIEDKQGEVMVFTLRGRLDSMTSPQLETMVLNSISAGTHRLLLDFAQVDYISSAGLRIVLMAAKKLKAFNGMIALCCLQTHVQAVFDIAGFLSILSIFDSAEGALRALNNQT